MILISFMLYILMFYVTNILKWVTMQNLKVCNIELGWINTKTLNCCLQTAEHFSAKWNVICQASEVDQFT